MKTAQPAQLAARGPEIDRNHRSTIASTAAASSAVK